LLAVEHPDSLRQRIEHTPSRRYLLLQALLHRHVRAEIEGSDEIGFTPIEVNLLRAEGDAYFAAVLALVPHHSALGRLLLRSKYIGLEAQELCTRIAVEGQCALLDCEKGAGFVLDDPHRQRIGFEDAPTARLARCQALVDRLELCDALTQMLLYLLGPLERLGVFLIAGIDSACSMRAGLHDEGRRRHGAGTLRRLREHCIDCGGQRL